MRSGSSTPERRSWRLGHNLHKAGTGQKRAHDGDGEEEVGHGEHEEGSEHGGVSSLLWSLVVRPVSGMEPQPTFFCHICLSNVEATARFVPQGQGQGACEHTFCQECIQGTLHVDVCGVGMWVVVCGGH